MLQATGHPLVAIMAECDEDGSLEALRAVRDAASYKPSASVVKGTNSDAGDAPADCGVAVAEATAHDTGAVELPGGTTAEKAVTSSANGARRIEAFVKQSQALVRRVSTPDRIRRRTAQLSRDIAEMAARQRARHARHLQDTQPHQHGGLLTRPTCDTTTMDAACATREREELPPNGEHRSGTGATRLPNLRKSFEAARQHYLIEAQREHSRFPPIQQPRVFSEKDPDAFSLRFQINHRPRHKSSWRHAAGMHETGSPFVRTDAVMQTDSPSPSHASSHLAALLSPSSMSFTSCVSVDATATTPTHSASANEMVFEDQVMPDDALREQRCGAQCDIAPAESRRTMQTVVINAPTAECVVATAAVTRRYTGPPTVALGTTEATATPQISRRSAQLAAARRRRDGVAGLSVTERLSRQAAVMAAAPKQHSRDPVCTFQSVIDDRSVRRARPTASTPQASERDSNKHRTATPPAQYIDPDCTFTPSINRDHRPGDAATAPLSRMQAWHARREHRLHTVRPLCHDEEKRENTFRPCILHL